MGVFDKSRHIRWLRSFTLEIGASILGLSLSAIRILFAPTEWAPSSAVPWQLWCKIFQSGWRHAQRVVLLWVFRVTPPLSPLRMPIISSPPEVDWGLIRGWWAWGGALSVCSGLHYGWKCRRRWACFRREILPLSIQKLIDFAVSARKCLFLCQNWV